MLIQKAYITKRNKTYFEDLIVLMRNKVLKIMLKHACSTIIMSQRN